VLRDLRHPARDAPTVVGAELENAQDQEIESALQQLCLVHASPLVIREECRGMTCRRSRGPRSVYSFNAKTNSERPDTVATYCLLPTRNVIGPLLMGPPRLVFQSNVPVRASSA